MTGSIPDPAVDDLVRGLIALTADQRERVAHALLPPPPEPVDEGLLQRPASILVVDDDIDIARLIEVNLRSDGWEVTKAEDGIDALSHVDASSFDVILTGVMMPRMDGLTLVQELRRRHDTRSTPIVICSARARAQDIIQGIASGADDYVIEPFDPVDLRARAAAALRRGRSPIA
jgi:DNA-binding response OmpR family regulator